MQNKSREKQSTHTDTITDTKHQNMSLRILTPSKNQRSEAAPLTLLSLHLY